MDENAWIPKLQESLIEIKILAANVDTKLDQLSLSVQKLEAGFEELKSVTNSQETRLALLEERWKTCASKLPENLNEDFVLMKSQINTYQRFTWILTTTVFGVVAKILFDAISL
ncbi:hypothetical protein OAA09_00505 [bacterium]|nr:hypothetical protein [bacterium]